MKKFLTICAALIFAVTANSFAQTATPENGEPIEFQQFGSYFVKNTFAMKEAKAYLVFDNKADFDKVFGAAARMGKNNFMPADAFDSKIVVSTIKSGELRKYSNVKVTAQNATLMVWYTATDSAQGSATYRVPLILAVEKGDYTKVVFMENGAQAGSVNIE